MSYLVKLIDPVDNRAYYMEWSSICDGPNTYGMSLEEFAAYYRDEYGRLEFEHRFPNRMKRVEEFGTSERRETSVHGTIGFNRAGKNETVLSFEQILEHFCRHPGEGELPEGSDPYGKIPAEISLSYKGN